MLNRILLFLTVLVGFCACVDEVIFVDKLSKDILVERDLALPLIKATLNLSDFTEGEADSTFFTGKDTILFYDSINFSFPDDTIEIGDFGENMEIDYLAVHHTVMNFFPVGLDAQLIIYDSVNDENIEKVYFSGDPSRLFIEPASVDSEGLVISNAVQETSGVFELDKDFFDKMFSSGTHLIVRANIPATDAYIKVLRNYSIKLDLGIEGSGRYTTIKDDQEN